MIVCRYFADNYAVESLMNLQFKVTEPSQFNDPFENSSYIPKFIDKELKKALKENWFIDHCYELLKTRMGVTNKKDFKRIFRDRASQSIQARLKTDGQSAGQAALEEQKEVFSNKNRVLCFSELEKITPDGDILMWAHYSNGHTGARISFDTEKFKWKGRMAIERVVYTQDRVMLDPIKILKRDPEIFDNLGKALCAKSLGWEYEQEYRWFIPTKKCTSKTINGRNLHFIQLPCEAIVGVDIGVKASKEFQTKIRECMKSNELAHVEVRWATLHETKYQLSYESQELSINNR